MNQEQTDREVRNAQIMVLDALQRLTAATGKPMRNISFDFAPEPDGTQKRCTRVTITLDDEA